jgi:type IV secretion system protein VirB10
MNGTTPEMDRVTGERDVNSISRVLSAQSRVSNFLAIGLMSVLGLGALTWYYANTLVHQGRSKELAQAAATKRAQGDLPLPSLGRIDPPMTSGSLEASSKPVDPPPDPVPMPPQTLMEVPLVQNAASPAATPQKTPEQLALERQLSGAVFASHGLLQSVGSMGSSDAEVAVGGAGAGMPAGVAAIGDGSNGVGAGGTATGGAGNEGRSVGPGSELPALLRASVTTAVRARVLPAQRLLLPKGAFIDCTLETAIDSTLPGMTTCVMATDTFGVDGQVVLLERGTKLIGETRGQVQQGAARIFVVWTEARTPTGVIVPLDSPGADELGRSGLPGEVNTHFWARFGAAMLVSVIDGAVEAGVQSTRGGSGTVVVNPTTSQDVMTDILKNTLNIPPTVVKHNGDRIQVLVARDLDFRSVYELRSVAAGR